MENNAEIFLIKILIIYICVMSVIAFTAMAADKIKAKRDKRRIRERTLLALAFLGGSPGALIGMLLCNHKVRKAKFFIGVPAALLIHFGLICYILLK